MSRISFYDGEVPSLQARGQWHLPPPRDWWLDLPERPTKLTFTLKQRLFGPMRSHTGRRLGLVGRMLYGWLVTDDEYFDRVDAELKFKGI